LQRNRIFSALASLGVALNKIVDTAIAVTAGITANPLNFTILLPCLRVILRLAIFCERRKFGSYRIVENLIALQGRVRRAWTPRRASPRLMEPDPGAQWRHCRAAIIWNPTGGTFSTTPRPGEFTTYSQRWIFAADKWSISLP
jgi:hypothetical protein